MSRNRRAPATFCAVASSIALTGFFVPVASAQELPLPESSSVDSTGGSSISSSLPGSSLPGTGDPGQDAPKNIIYMVGDGMGYNHVAATNLYESGQTRHQVEGEPGDVAPVEGGEAAQVYEGDEWNQRGMSTYQDGNSYDPERAWADHDYVSEDFTDSAAAGTAMATGSKTTNGMIGVDTDGETLNNTSEQAIANDKSAGVVSSVPFNHATPASWAAHNPDRNDYHGMADEMLDSDLSVIMGAGHPLYDEDNQPTDPNYEWISEESYSALSSGETDFSFVEEDADFAKLADGDVEPDQKYFGLPQVASTLQYNRSGESETPGDVEHNDVVDLSTMAEGALNVLNQDEKGFHVMIEGGAIDWAGHDNSTARDIEEVQAFNGAVDTVSDWVEENSSWDETLVVVTADHETGYLTGPDNDPNWSALTGDADAVPDHAWHSGGHTNQLVPVFFRGPGSDDIIGAADEVDPVRGNYLDNVEIADLTINNWWRK
ncbi:MAG: alkaline phosphatase [Mycobacteriaceae bacterium]|uniref:alkaline phosphatase n=1 Tax=Corynebacterium sp. TaxID=1720 RepID=UPI003F94A4AD